MNGLKSLEFPLISGFIWQKGKGNTCLKVKIQYVEIVFIEHLNWTNLSLFQLEIITKAKISF